jgi:hypothetical protein
MDANGEDFNPLSQFNFHSRNPSSLVDTSEIDHRTLDSNPDEFYRRVSVDNSTNLPDIFIEDDMASRKLNGSAARPSASQPGTLPRTTFRSTSNPTTNGSLPSKAGVIRERLKQFDQSLKPTSQTSRPVTPNNRDAGRDGSRTTPGKRRKEAPKRPLLFGEVVDSGNEAGYGIPSLAKQRSELTLPKPPAGSRQRRHSDQQSRPVDSHSRSASEDTEIENEPSPKSNALSTSRIPRPRNVHRVSDGSAPKTSPPSRLQPKPPATLSNRRYAPKRPMESNQTLTAVIKEPPPKLSPPLRSSRPRQPVSSASTAASRAKITERFEKSIAEKSVHRSTPKDLIHVDIAQRRDQVSNKLLKSYYNGPVLDDKQPKKTSAGASRRDFSPLIEAALADAEDESAIDESLADMPTHNASTRAQDTLLKQVLSMRDLDPDSPDSPLLHEDLMSHDQQGETVQIVLGATPKLPSENFANPDHPHISTMIDDDFDFGDGRSTICPDDSVSMIFQRRYTAEASPPPVPKLETAHYTIDSAARSQINHYLDEYQERNMPTPKPSVPEESLGQRQWQEASHQGHAQDLSEERSIRQSGAADEDDDGYRGHAIIYSSKRYVYFQSHRVSDEL